MSSGKTTFTGYLISFLAIVGASLVFLVGLAYWNGNTTESESSCITSSGEEC